METLFSHPLLSTLWLAMILVTLIVVSMIFSRPFNEPPFPKKRE